MQQPVLQNTFTSIEAIHSSNEPITIEVDSTPEKSEMLDYSSAGAAIESYLSRPNEKPVYLVEGDDVTLLTASPFTFGGAGVGGLTITTNLRALHFYMDDPSSLSGGSYIQARLVLSTPGNIAYVGRYQFRSDSEISFNKSFVLIDSIRYYAIVIDGTGIREGKQKKQLIFPLGQI